MKLDPTILLYGLILIVGVVTLWQWHRNPKYEQFSLIDLIADDGKVSSRKFIEFGTWIVMTVAFVILVERDKLTEWYVLAYGGIWVAARTAGQAIHMRKDQT